jgi:hypothetical protein
MPVCLISQPSNAYRNTCRKSRTAAKVSFAKCALLQDQTQILFEVNNAKARQSTSSVGLGKAKVIGYKKRSQCSRSSVRYSGGMGGSSIEDVLGDFIDS